MAEPLDISKDLKLPIEVAGQVIALVGIRNSGKTNSAGVIAEELLDRHQQVVFIDPTDGSWGLRSGYPIFIFGGPHGDIPLAETDGKGIAEFVVAERVPLILSLRHLRKAGQRRFVTEFCEELYHLKGRPENRSPLTVFIDEAPLFVPQRVMGEMARVVGAVEDLCARGRNTGFGVVLVTQRPATINKDVLSQADTIIAHRLISPQDRKALGEWLEENASAEKLKEILVSLAGMPKGQAWVWAPQLDIMRQVQIRKRHTFDSSASPEMGQVVARPKHLHDVNLETLKAKLAANVERTKLEDPKALRQELQASESKLVEIGRQRAELEERVQEYEHLAYLQRQREAPWIERWQQETGKVNTLPDYGDMLAWLASKAEQAEKLAQVPALDEQLVARFEAAMQGVSEISAEINGALLEVIRGADEIRRFQAVTPPGEIRQVFMNPEDGIVALPGIRFTGPTVGGVTVIGAEPKGPAERILRSLAWWRAAHIEAPTREQVAFGARYTVNGHFNNIMGDLRTQGLVDYPDGGLIALTPAGAKAASRFQVDRPTRQALIDNVRGLIRNSTPKLRIFDALVKANRVMTREALAAAADYTVNGHFNNMVGELRTAGIVEYPGGGQVALSSVFASVGR